jgi:hypothetical protein
MSKNGIKISLDCPFKGDFTKFYKSSLTSQPGTIPAYHFWSNLVWGEGGTLKSVIYTV